MASPARSTILLCLHKKRNRFAIQQSANLIRVMLYHYGVGTEDKLCIKLATGDTVSFKKAKQKKAIDFHEHCTCDSLAHPSLLFGMCKMASL